jgi:antirestriction protein ArdC
MKNRNQNHQPKHKPAHASSDAVESEGVKQAGKRDTYQTVTDAILAALATCGPGERPWARAGLTMPVNAVSGHTYRGSNIVMLWIAAQEAGYSQSRWATFKQWAEKGARVRKGEKGTPVLWFKMLDRKDDGAGESDEGGRKIPCARLAWVFNIDQVEGYEDTAPLKLSGSPVEAIVLADALLAASGARIAHGGAQAFYRPSTDEIVLPPREAFTGTSTSTATESYYAVALHELVHWTGNKARLSRELGSRFGTQAYAAEELIAELGAAFLCAELGITSEPRPDHAAYLASWAKLLADDRRAFTTAAAKAAEASDYLLAMLSAGELQKAA